MTDYIVIALAAFGIGLSVGVTSEGGSLKSDCALIGAHAHNAVVFECKEKK